MLLRLARVRTTGPTFGILPGVARVDWKRALTQLRSQPIATWELSTAHVLTTTTVSSQDQDEKAATRDLNRLPTQPGENGSHRDRTIQQLGGLGRLEVKLRLVD